MTCSMPTVDDLEKWLNTDIPEDQEDYAALLIQAASDMIALMLGGTCDPYALADTDVLCRSLTYAILDLAHYLSVQSDNKTELYAPFTSERIGSYSYSKAMQDVIHLAQQGQPTGLIWLDSVLPVLREKCAGQSGTDAGGMGPGAVAHVSTHIMPEAGVNRPRDFWQITDPVTPVGGGFFSADPADRG